MHKDGFDSIVFLITLPLFLLTVERQHSNCCAVSAFDTIRCDFFYERFVMFLFLLLYFLFYFLFIYLFFFIILWFDIYNSFYCVLDCNRVSSDSLFYIVHSFAYFFSTFCISVQSFFCPSDISFFLNNLFLLFFKQIAFSVPSFIVKREEMGFFRKFFFKFDHSEFLIDLSMTPMMFPEIFHFFSLNSLGVLVFISTFGILPGAMPKIRKKN